MIRNNFIYYTDDDQDDLDIFSEAVMDINPDAVVVTYNHGSKVLDALNSGNKLPEILFLDLNMPGMDGITVLKSIRNTELLGSLPVVILSTSSNKETIDECELNGATYYIPKPNDYDTLKSGLEHVLCMDWSNYDAKEKGFVFKKANAKSN